MTEKRKDIAPPVVALLPLSGEVDVQQLWNLILGGFLKPSSDGKQHSTRGGEAMDDNTIAGLCQNLNRPQNCLNLAAFPAHTMHLSSCSTVESVRVI